MPQIQPVFPNTFIRPPPPGFLPQEGPAEGWQARLMPVVCFVETIPKSNSVVSIFPKPNPAGVFCRPKGNGPFIAYGQPVVHSGVCNERKHHQAERH